MTCELCGDRETLDPSHICGACTSILDGAPNDRRIVPPPGNAVPNPPPSAFGVSVAAGELRGRLAIVTGGNRGIGRAIAERLMDCGADVHIVDLHDSNIREIEAYAADRGCAFSFTRSDVTNAESVRTMAGRLAQANRSVDILVNNAGVFHAASILEHSRRDWDHQFAVNVTAAFTVTQAVLPLIPRNAGARVVNLASVAGLTGAALAAGYIASKHAMVGLTRALAMELAPAGINVNAIAPGFVDTDMLAQIAEELAQLAGHNDARRQLQELIDAIPQKRLLQPEEIAEVALYLVSNASAGMTGEIVNFSGGWLLS